MSTPAKFVLAALLAALTLLMDPDPGAAAVRFVGDANFAAHTLVGETRFNGLSGIAYDADQNLYYVVSDDRAEFGPARLYQVTIEIAETVRVTPREPLFLRGPDNQPWARHTVDFEGIVILPDDNLLISSEGAERRGINASLHEFSRDGRYIKEWRLPAVFDVDRDADSGIRNNLALESLAITPDGRFIFTANEQALKQDGPVASIDNGSPVRIVKFDSRGEVLSHYFYMVDPLPTPARSSTLKGDNGLVELIALSESRLLALERSYLPELDRTAIRLFRVDLSDALDVSGLDSLSNARSEVRFADKELVLDFDSILPLLDPDFRSLDNLEGFCFGPWSADGARSLVLVSDGNFNSTQRTQFIVLEIVP